jgi:hypothetical protein
MNPSLDLFKSIGGALLALAVIAVIGWVAISRIRAWMKAPDATEEGFTLADLRRLHREGSLSDEEFERAHAQIISAVRRKPSKKDTMPPKHPPTASPVDHRLPAAKRSKAPTELTIDLTTDPPVDPPVDPPTRPEPETPKRPAARADQTGRIVIRDEGGQGAADAPRSPTRPKRPADPRTDHDRG